MMNISNAQIMSSNWATVCAPEPYDPKVHCPQGGHHVIEYRRQKTAGGLDDYDAVCVKCGVNFGVETTTC